MKRFYRYSTLFLIIVGSELLTKAFFPSLGVFVDFFLLLFIFLGLQLSSTRFLWLWGAGIGFLKDVATGGFFGGWLCTFALLGCVFELGRNFLEQEDPLVQGFWTGMMTIVSGVVYGIIVVLADPVVGWSRPFWWVVPFSAVINGLCAASFFPRVKKWLLA